MCVHKHGVDWDEGPWEYHQECSDYLLACDELDEAKNYFKEILKFLYCENSLNVEELEYYLIEMAEKLQVKFPENKNLNIRAKCTH